MRRDRAPSRRYGRSLAKPGAVPVPARLGLLSRHPLRHKIARSMRTSVRPSGGAELARLMPPAPSLRGPAAVPSLLSPRPSHLHHPRLCDPEGPYKAASPQMVRPFRLRRVIFLMLLAMMPWKTSIILCRQMCAPSRTLAVWPLMKRTYLLGRRIPWMPCVGLKISLLMLSSFARSLLLLTVANKLLAVKS